MNQKYEQVSPKVHVIRQTAIVENVDGNVASVDVNMPIEPSQPATIEVVWFGEEKAQHTFNAVRVDTPHWWELSGPVPEVLVCAPSTFHDLTNICLQHSQILRTKGAQT